MADLREAADEARGRRHRTPDVVSVLVGDAGFDIEIQCRTLRTAMDSTGTFALSVRR